LGDFAIDTAVRAKPGSPGRYTADVSRDWEIRGPNGGFLAALALRAAGAEAKIARPVSFNVHFLRAAQFAPIEIDVQTLHAGRTSESLQVSLHQDGRRIIEALVRTVAPTPGLAHDVAQAPPTPHPNTLPSPQDLFPDQPWVNDPYWLNIGPRIIDTTLWRKTDAGPWPPVYREWYRFSPRARFEDVWIDAGRLAVLMDSMSWRAAQQPHPTPRLYYGSTVEFSIWFHRADLSAEWLLVDYEAPVAEGGTMGATGRIWSDQGKLLASGGAQLMCLPFPSKP